MFTEPRTYGLAKYRLWYSIAALIFIIVVTFIEYKEFPLSCIGPFILLALYLFVPFSYKLTVSDKAISAFHFFRTQTLNWSDFAEVGTKNGGLVLINRDGDVKVFINPQIDGYPDVIKFIQKRRPDLWKLDDTKTFHQNIVQSTILGVMGLPIIYVAIAVALENGFSFSQDFLLVLLGLLMGGVLLWGGIKIREITFDMDYLVAKYIVWERRIHVSEVYSVGLEQQMGKNEVSYPVHIRLKKGRHIVVEKVKEGNPILVNAIELWMEKYKGKHNDRP